jgi:hypothetical protein
MHQPGSRTFIEADPSAGRLVGSDILLRCCACKTLHRAVMNDCDALYLLPVNDDRLSDALIYRGGLRERSAGEPHNRSRQHGKKKSLNHDSPRKTHLFGISYFYFIA